LSLPCQKESGLAVALCNQFRELLFRRVHTFRPTPDIRWARKVRSRLAPRNNDGQCLQSIATDDLRDVCNSWIDLLHLTVEFLCDFFQVLLWSFYLSVVTNSDVQHSRIADWSGVREGDRCSFPVFLILDGLSLDHVVFKVPHSREQISFVQVNGDVHFSLLLRPVCHPVTIAKTKRTCYRLSMSDASASEKATTSQTVPTSDGKMALPTSAISEGMLTENLKTLRVLHQLLMVVAAAILVFALRVDRSRDYRAALDELRAMQDLNFSGWTTFVRDR